MPFHKSMPATSHEHRCLPLGDGGVAGFPFEQEKCQ